MSMSSHLLKRAIGLWESGQKSQSHRLLETIIYNDRCNEAAWVWYIYTSENDKEKVAALENFLTIFPQHAMARKALASLQREIPQSVPARPTTEIIQRKRESLPSLKPVPSPVPPPTPRSQPKSAAWVLVVLGFCLLLFSLAASVTRYGSLQLKYQSLAANRELITRNFEQLSRDYESLKSENVALSNQYNSLLGEYQGLNSRYSTLQATYDILSNEHSILRNNYDSLSLEHNQLIDKYNGLAGDYNRLDSVALKPPYIFIHDRIVQTTFYDTNGHLISWNTPFSGLEYAIERGDILRRQILDEGRYTTTVYTESGDVLSIRDFSVFVTPDPFDQVMPNIYHSSTSAYDFIYRTWNIIGQLSNYASEETETPRYPYETLLAGGGDCEDLSILFASLIKAAAVNWYVDLVYVDSENILDPQKHDHVLVYVDTGQEAFLVETTSDQVMLPYDRGVVGWLAANLESNNEEDRFPTYLH